MKISGFYIVLLASILLCVYSSGIKAQNRVLFIGNSFTYAHGSETEPEIPALVNGISEKMNPADILTNMADDNATVPGQTLEGHWNSGKALAKIKQGGWAFVVLQEYSITPYSNPELYYKYVRLFDAEIKKAGAKTVFYLTWSRRENWFQFPTLLSNTEIIAAETHAVIAPCGKAWEKIRTEKPEINLYEPDAHHASSFATYLNACVIFSTLSGRNPEETSYVPTIIPISPDEAQYARKIAWQTVQAYKQADTIPPSVPTGLILSNIGSETCTLSWAASTDQVSAYQVFISEKSQGTCTGTSMNISGLKCATNYLIAVKACDISGNCSIASKALPVTTLKCTLKR